MSELSDESRQAKAHLKADWPSALTVREPTGWSVYGGVDDPLEAMALLASEAQTEDEAWIQAFINWNALAAEQEQQ